MAYEELKSSGITEKTPGNIVLGAGTIHKGLKFDPETKKWNFEESLIGATSGGSTFSITPEITNIDVDGALVKMKGLAVKTGETATIQTNVIELTPELLSALPEPEEDIKIVLVGNLPRSAREGILTKYSSKRYVLTPFSQKEYAGASPDLFGQKPIALTMTYPRPGFFDSLRNGFLPRPDLQQANHAFYEGWLGDFFFNVVRPVMKVSKEVEFLNFMKSIARTNMQELNHSKYAKEAGISYATAIYWTEFLVDCGVLLEISSMQLSQRRQVKRSKMTYADTGLLAFLLECASAEELFAHPTYEGVFTGFVASEIIKNYAAVGQTAPLVYYRDTAHKHVELVLQTPKGWLPIAFLSRKARSVKESIRHVDVLIKIGGDTQDILFVSDGTLTVESTSYPVLSATAL